MYVVSVIRHLLGGFLGRALSSRPTGLATPIQLSFVALLPSEGKNDVQILDPTYT